MKNTDIFNIKPVCLFVVVVIVCIVQRQSILKMYIYKKKVMGANFWLVFFCCGVLFSGFNGKCAWLPNPPPKTVQYGGFTRSKSS